MDDDRSQSDHRGSIAFADAVERLSVDADSVLARSRVAHSVQPQQQPQPKRASIVQPQLHQKKAYLVAEPSNDMFSSIWTNEDATKHSMSTHYMSTLSTQTYASFLERRKKKGARYSVIHQQNRAGSIFKMGSDWYLTLDELLATIKLFYTFKEEEEARRKQLGRPAISLEQYFFKQMRLSFQNAVRHTRLVLFAVSQYSRKDSRVFVFGKLLQNSLPESFLNVKDKLEDEIEIALMEQMTHGGRHAQSFASEWQRRLDYGVPLEEAKRALATLYNSDDIKLLMRRVEENAEARRVPIPSIMHQTIIFQAERTETYWAEMAMIFAEVNYRGVVWRDDMDDIFSSIASTSCDVTKSLQDLATSQVLERLKECGDGYFTFSDCCEVFDPLLGLKWSHRHRDPLWSSSRRSTSLERSSVSCISPRCSVIFSPLPRRSSLPSRSSVLFPPRGSAHFRRSI